jgi:hypothetical protein
MGFVKMTMWLNNDFILENFFLTTWDERRFQILLKDFRDGNIRPERVDDDILVAYILKDMLEFIFKGDRKAFEEKVQGMVIMNQTKLNASMGYFAIPKEIYDRLLREKESDVPV